MDLDSLTKEELENKLWEIETKIIEYERILSQKDKEVKILKEEIQNQQKVMAENNHWRNGH
jgi:DNA gyrase/topoisomerase IV subunit A